MDNENTQIVLIDAEETRRLAGNVSLRTLDKLMAENKFPLPSKIRRKRFWSKGEIQAWIADRLQARGSEAA